MLVRGFVRYLRGEEGATVIEYGVIAAFIGVALILSMPHIRDVLKSLYNKLGNALASNI